MDSSRRLFMRIVSGLGLALALPGRALARFVRSLKTRTVERADFYFDPDKGRVIYKGGKSEPYVLRLEGMVEKPVELSYGDLLALPQREQVSDFHCVEGWSVKDLRWGGFGFNELLKKAQAKPEASHAVFHSLGKTNWKPGGLDHYVESFPLSELLDPKRQIIMALRLDGKPLSPERGAPLRVAAPLEQGYKSIKFVTRIELTNQERPGWWTRANPIYTIKARVSKYRLRSQ